MKIRAILIWLMLLGTELAISQVSQTVTAIQYYYDTDPGLGVAGNGAIVAVTPAASITQSFAFNTPNVSDGMHTLFVRAQNESGIWGLSERRNVFIQRASQQITAIQYYYDNDPGVGIAGNGGIVAVSPQPTITNVSFALNTPNIAEGAHWLFVRAKDEYGKWGLAERRMVYLERLSQSVVGVEYYFDTDPGVGNGTYITLTPAPSVTTMLPLTVPNLSLGTHTLYMRAKNESGKYGIITSSTVTIACTPTLEYRSKQSGAWNLASTWETFDGCVWVNASSPPSQSDSTITILSGHIVTFPGAAIVNQVVVNTGGTLTINGGTMTVSDVSGDDLIVNGTLNFSSGTIQGAGQMIINSGGTYIWAGGNLGGSGTTDIHTGATAQFSGGATVNLLGTRILTNSTNFTISATGSIVINAGTAFNNNANGTINFTNNGSITNSGVGTLYNDGIVTKSGGVGISNFGTTSSLILNNTGALNANVGTLNVNGTGTFAGTMNVDTGATLSGNMMSPFIGTTITNNGNVTLAGLTFAGSSLQQLNGSGTISELTMDNTSGLNLNGTQTITGAMNFNNGIITTGSNKLIIGANSTVGTSAFSWINGNLQRNFTTGSSMLYAIGDVSVYTPVVIVTNVSTIGSGGITVTTSVGDHPAISSSGINANRSVNRTWHFTNNSAIFDSCSIDFYWSPADNDGAIDGSTLIAAKYDSPTWTFPVVTNSTAISITLQHITSFSDFQIGNALCNPVYSSQNITLCAGDSVAISTHTYHLNGIYTDTLTSINGCDSILTTNLTLNPAITHSQTQTICSGSSIVVSTNTYITSGVYTDILIASNGCDSTVTTNLTVIPILSNSQSITVCPGGTVTVGTNTYNTNGIYVDTLTSFAGCDSIVTTNLTVVVQLAAASLSANTCYGVSQTLSVNGGSGTIYWSPAVGLNTNVGNSVVASPLNTTMYYVTDTVGACQMIDSTLLTVNPLITADAGAHQSLCLGDTATFVATGTGGSGTYTYSWNDGVHLYSTDTISIVPSSNLTFTLTITDTAVCSATDTVTFSSRHTDIYGLVTYSGGILSHGTNNKAILYRWYNPNLAQFDTMQVSSIDTVSGYFHFTNVYNNNLLIKIFPDTSIYAHHFVPSYYNAANLPTSLWDSTTFFIHTCNAEDTLNIVMVENQTLSGSGHVSGRLVQGPFYSPLANGMPRVQGDPIPGGDVKMGNNPGGQMIAATTTSSLDSPDGGGYYYFDSIPVGHYDIYIDIPGLLRDSVWTIYITPTDTVFTNLDYWVDSSDIYPINPDINVQTPIIKGLESTFIVYPNPFRTNATIEYTVSHDAQVKLEVYSMIGDKINTLVNDNQQTSKYKFNLNASNRKLSNGVYFIKLTVGNDSFTKRVVVIQ